MKGMVHFLVISLCLVTACSRAGSSPQEDPRIALFEKFNRAASYDEIRSLLSGVLAVQLEQVHAKADSNKFNVLNRLRLASYTSRIVEINENTSSCTGQCQIRGWKKRSPSVPAHPPTE